MCERSAVASTPCSPSSLKGKGLFSATGPIRESSPFALRAYHCSGSPGDRTPLYSTDPVLGLLDHHVSFSKKLAAGANGSVTQPVGVRENSYSSPSLRRDARHDSVPAKHWILGAITCLPSSETSGT